VSDARRLVIVLVVAAAVVGLLPGVIARSHRVQLMRAALTEVVAECRARYAGAHTAADSAAADAWQPPLHGERRPGDPTCGAYRRRNMLETGAGR
jgi:hypothetical protein